MTATITRPKPKKAAATKAQSPYKRLHVIIPIEDILWASQQKPSVNQLWQECWTADPYGSRWMPLTSALGYSTFISAKKILSESGLFIFKPDKSIQDGRETASWMVKNLHGSRMKEFWEKANSASPKPDAEKRESNAENTEMNAGSKEMGALYKASISVQINSEQGFQETSRTAQEHREQREKVRSGCSSQLHLYILNKPWFFSCDACGGLRLRIPQTCYIRPRFQHLTKSRCSLANGVRNHWEIENSLHWILDVALREDDCRIRKDNAPQNFAMLRQIAVNLLSQEKRVKRGIKNKQFLAAMDNNYLARVLALA